MRPRLAKITTPDWTAEFETDGRVCRAERRIAYMRGWTDEEVRAHVKEKGWKATRVMTKLDKAEADTVVQAIMSVFPGAEVVAVRDEKDSVLGDGMSA